MNPALIPLVLKGVGAVITNRKANKENNKTPTAKAAAGTGAVVGTMLATVEQTPEVVITEAVMAVVTAILYFWNAHKAAKKVGAVD